jgi:hypothetical protein
MYEGHHELECYIIDRQRQMINEAEHFRLLKQIRDHSRQTLRTQLGCLLVDAGTRLQDHNPAFRPQPGLDTLQY